MALLSQGKLIFKGANVFIFTNNYPLSEVSDKDKLEDMDVTQNKGGQIGPLALAVGGGARVVGAMQLITVVGLAMGVGKMNRVIV